MHARSGGPLLMVLLLLEHAQMVWYYEASDGGVRLAAV
jgi:hypothetical protein